ncbi:hypothetical protein O181_104157 [Austropuccinia psidii MF-1]|uniref:Integrase catalytic domain-containing protein n=1 Tax=Austropuccinia psidii MF-1 TaxID=1389203 RepID=A0A9Q3PL58_9BASI|nr:hypothetical protein [Austropuccinia psidii MF-1]
MDTALLLWNRDIPHTGLFKDIVSDRDSKLPSALWTNLHRLFGTNLSFCTAYHPQNYGLAEIMIQALEDMIKIFCAYSLEFNESDISVHSSKSQTPAILEKGWNPTLPEHTLRKNLAKIHPKSSSFKMMLDKVKHHSKQSINETFDHAKQKWDKSHEVPDFKLGDLGPFFIVALHGNNAFQVELSGKLENKHLSFQVRLIKSYQPAYKELFPMRNPSPLAIPPVEQSEDKKIEKVIKERGLRGENQREYPIRYRNPVHEDEWLAEPEIPDFDKLLRRFRHEKRPQP